MNKVDIKSYIENYLNEIFVENINISILKNSYILNNELKFNIYEFWNKNDEELLNDFNNFSFKNDYISTIFFFLSGYWEYTHSELKDKIGRFPAIESFQFKKEILEEPVVEIIVEKIRKELNLNYKQNNTKIFITHDIDFLGLLKGFNFIKNLGGDILKRKDIKLFFDKLIKKIINSDPCSVENLISIHKKYGTTGTFFFIPDIQGKKFGGGYDPTKKKKYLKKLEKEINKINGNVGIHYDAEYLNKNRMEKDIEKLKNIFNSKIDKGRSHYLMFDIKKSFDIYEKAGIKLDSTGGYADRVGFRFGTCKPFKPFNFDKGKEYNIIEIPLIIMEGTLQSQKYMNLTSKEGFEKIKEIINKIKKYNGVFTFLWHNTSFYNITWKDWEWVYEETIKYSIKKELKCISADNLVKGENN
ncbi:hypothetical protein OSSY52_03180 [Tepiditoga spiralis]|uniref:DUF7033 domain-containing protein n=1 Tax=Tepiditoga spiralis TaxID=2108365 RepID=A0A7G1G5L2_9BACT|nr:hypothetical protein [Tepiditoga spiralis]BBE30177.1 hypothetical protein OSSY52_03180 [Tepiditoga spiralis]